MTPAFNTEKHRGNGWFVFLGIVMIVTGVGAVTFSFEASLSVELFVASAFLVIAFATLIQAFREKEWGDVFWQFAIGVIYLVGGILMLANPLGGVLVLTVFLGATFFAEGIARIVIGFQMRSAPKWGFLVASGGTSVLLGILVFAGMANGASLTFIGILLGINVVFAGASLLVLGSSKLEQTEEQPA